MGGGAFVQFRTTFSFSVAPLFPVTKEFVCKLQIVNDVSIAFNALIVVNKINSNHNLRNIILKCKYPYYSYVNNWSNNKIVHKCN